MKIKTVRKSSSWLTTSTFVLLSSFAFTPVMLSAEESAEEKGLRLAKASDQRDLGFGDFVADMQMILRNRAGEKSSRKIRNRTLEGHGDGDKSMSLFDDPADVKGTAMLTFSHGLNPDDQWLYLPALKRVKRISSRNKSGPFMGSEFAFEDLGSEEVEKYEHLFLREEACDGDQGWQCYVSQRIPAYQYSGYSKQIGWMDTKEYRPIKIEFYDRKGDLLKTLTWKNYQEYSIPSGEKTFWRADQMEMKNHQTGKISTLNWTNYQFSTGLDENDFNKNALKRLF